MHPKEIGDRSTLAVMLALRAAGYEVLVPFGENTRYDLVIDDGHSLSTYAHHPNPVATQRSYLGEVDAFAVYCPETSGIYLIPIDDLPVVARAALRVEPARNGQKRFIRLAANYEVARITCVAAHKTPELHSRG